MNTKILLVVLLAAGILTACAGASGQLTATAEPTASETRTLRVMTHDSFLASEEVITRFEIENNVKVQFLESGDAGTALNKAILSKSNPLADVLYGVDNTLLSRALEEDIFEPYNSPLLTKVPDEFKLDPDNRALPVDYGDVCLNYDIAYLSEKQLEPPQSLDDLLRPEYKGLLVVENPASSSPGLAFLLATIDVYGEDGYINYWQKLVENDVLIVNDWNTAYYTEFTRSGGSRPIVVSYASSPPAEVVFAEQPIDRPPTASVTTPGTCFRQVEFVGILAGTPNRDLAEKWIDFMLSVPFQEDIPLQMFVFPVNPEAMLPDVFVQFASISTEPAQVDPDLIAEKREKWIADWTEAVLK